MKCQLCDGTGTSNTCVNGTFKPCSFCDGTGEYEPFDADIELDKLDSEPQTNEEWLDRKSTKEKAEWLDKVAENCCQICDEENRELCRGNIAIGCKFENAEKWELWLKQPHKE